MPTIDFGRQTKARFALSTGKSVEIPVNFPVSMETEPKNLQTESAAAIPASRPYGDCLRRQNLALKPGKAGVFREVPEETANAETSWRCRESRANPSLMDFPVMQGKYREFSRFRPILALLEPLSY